MMKYKIHIATVLLITFNQFILAQPNWPQLKANATFLVADTNEYNSPKILPINVGGWEDGLYVTRDGKHLFSTYIPIDIFSWLSDFYLCIDFNPYYRGPLYDIDTSYNIWSCPNYMHSDIVKTERIDKSLSFNTWHSSNLKKPLTFEGGACGVLINKDSFDVFVFTKDTGSLGMELMFLKDVSTNPSFAGAIPIMSSPQQEDNPHIERLPNGELLLIFDRNRYVYYALSNDNGINWTSPQLITNVINDHAPYDIQPHLWNDGTVWWMYFCADDTKGLRSIYRSKQTIANNWDSWAAKELVLSPTGISGGFGNAIGIGEPTLTEWGDLYFVTVYGNTIQSDTTDVFDCDPWVMKRKIPIVNSTQNPLSKELQIKIYPNPFSSSTILHAKHLFNNASLTVYNSFGQIVKEIKHINEQTIILHRENLPNGLYFIRLTEENKHIVTNKIIITD